MRTPRILIAAVALSSLILAGCSDAEPQTIDQSPSAAASDEASQPAEPETEESSPEPKGTVVEITIDGDSVEPNGARVEAHVGEPITLQITSDREGELHVHSTPEQEIPFDNGTTEAELTIDRPGVVEVEDHHSGLVIVQLEVS
jgi:uncharacterized protein YcfL